ncbi:MAG: recombinase family protein [Prolixibacteraceae bacterium]
MKRAIAFTRVSTTKQDDGVRQLNQIQKYCNEKGYILQEKIISEIVSGVSNERQGLVELEELTREDADIVIVSETSRLTRKDENDFLDLYIVVKTVQKTGLDLFFVGGGQEYKADRKLSLIDVITLVIEADRNAKEREINKMRFATGKKAKAESGGFIGHNLPFGYRNNGQDKNYFEVIEEQAELIKIMFDLVYTYGYSVNKTAITMVRTHNTSWNTRSVLNILKNPAYKGEASILGFTQYVPAIVSAEIFDSVQEKIATNHLFISKATRNVNTLKGLSKCACGCSTYIRNSGNADGKTYFNYQCSSKNSSYTQVSACKNGGINVSLLDSVVWNCTKSFINVDDFKAKTEQQKKLIILEIKGIEKQINLLKAEKIELESREENIINSISRTSYEKVQTMLETELSGLIEQSEKTEKRVSQLIKEYQKLQNKLNDLAFTLLNSQVSNTTPEEKNKIYLKYIERVTYYSVNMNKGFVVINYKNGVEVVVVTSSRPNYVAYQLPQSFSFNPKTRKIITPLTEFDNTNTFSIPSLSTKELNYSEFKKIFNIEEFKMDIDYQNNIEEQYQTEYNEKLADLGEVITEH